MLQVIHVLIYVLFCSRVLSRYETFSNANSSFSGKKGEVDKRRSYLLDFGSNLTDDWCGMQVLVSFARARKPPANTGFSARLHWTDTQPCSTFGVIYARLCEGD